jgi:DNA-binding SARP family transcriptional activator/tetratricopeptide (TPR) repeat protein/TolB-like protein
MIELRTLGALELTSAECDAAGSVLAQPRRAALLCYLALALPRGFHRRDTLFALFWPEDDAEQARHALRQSIYFLRRALGAGTIVSRGDEELALAADRIRCDVWAFEAAVDEGRAAEALALYRGDLLPGFHISAAPDFERWLDEERRRLRHLAREAGWAVAAAREREGDGAGAAEAASGAVALAPTDEAAVRRLLLLLERVGDRAAAVHVYEAFAGRLRGEFELEPAAETRELVARIRHVPDQTPAGRAAPGTRRAPAAGDGRSGSVMRTAEPSRPESVPVPPLPSPRSQAVRPAVLTAVTVIALLLGLTGLQQRHAAHDTVGARPPPAAEPATGIAVLPFASQGEALAIWREGLVNLVSLDLSGVAGLRAIDSRTLLARWRARGAAEDTVQLASALALAAGVGARYAVVGSVMSDGGDLLLTAGVHEVAGLRELGTARARGPADSIFTLVDRLTLEILRLILRGEAGGLPRVDLSRVSTASLPALKAYLQGEVFFRKSQFQLAAEAYERAVEADSTFALARYRLGLSRRWFWSDTTGTVPDPLKSTVGRFADRLPPHESAMLRGILLRERDLWAAREVLEEEARRYPDDAETMYELAELYYHYGHQALVPLEAADRVFARAIELDSTFTLPYIHRIDYAIAAGDRSEATRLLGIFTRLAPGSSWVAWFNLVTALALGSTSARSGAEAALDTLEIGDLFWLGLTLRGQRCCWRLAEHVFRKARARGELTQDATRLLFWMTLGQGKASEALGWVDDPFMPEEHKGLMLQVLDELGLPIPPTRLDSTLAFDPADSSTLALFTTGSYAASRGRWRSVRDALQRLQLTARHRATTDSSEAGFIVAVSQGLEGYAWWRRGQREQALSLLQHAQRHAVGNWRREVVNARLRWWLGSLLTEMGRPREALPYFRSLTNTALPADHELARIYEQLGMDEQAREAYALFLARRNDADLTFRPMMRHAREALLRLGTAATE